MVVAYSQREGGLPGGGSLQPKGRRPTWWWWLTVEGKEAYLAVGVPQQQSPRSPALTQRSFPHSHHLLCKCRHLAASYVSS